MRWLPPVFETPPAGSDETAGFARQRDGMVKDQLVRRGIGDDRVLAAMARVPRHEFVSAENRASAYEDRPLPIGVGQTISQPFIVALTAQTAGIPPGGRVLEVGSGCGYQAAVLAQLAIEVCSLEIIPALARRARETCERLGYLNVRVGIGDGYVGWPEWSPFDAIVVAAAPAAVPSPLLEQLKMGGRLVVPVGREEQTLIVITRERSGYRRDEVMPVRFVPMTGRAAERSN